MRTPHILIIRFSALGDVAMTVPVVDSLARQYPDIRITVLSRGFARPFFEYMPPNVSFMEADIKNEYSGVKGLNALFRRLLAKNFTAIADFHGVIRSEFLDLRFKLNHYNVAVIDKHRNGRRQLVSASDKQLKMQPSPFRNYSDVLYKLGYPVRLDFKSIFANHPADLTRLPPELGRKREKGEIWIGVAPFAAHEGKIYPPRLMEQVVTLLLKKHSGAKIFFFGGGEKEMEVFDEWRQKHKRCLCASALAGNMSTELIFMGRLDIMVSMDSANMHMASLTGVPVVTVWGATHPFAGFNGWGQSIDNAVQIDLPCRPCSIYGNKPCLRGDYACMKNISPEQIVEKVETVLRLRTI